MKFISETPTHQLFVGDFNGLQIRITKNKATGETFFNSDDVAKALGFKDHEDMVSNKEIQQLIKKHDAQGKGSMFIESENRSNIN